MRFGFIFGTARLALSLLVMAPAAVPVLAANPTNRGGVVVLHVEGDAPYDYGSYGHCADLRLVEADSAIARMPGDGTARLVGAYAVFPADSVGTIKAMSFGIRYSSSVKVIAYGACHGGGLDISMNGWPGSQGGTSFNVMPDAVQEARVIPIYWFALSCRGAGSFEIIPHPMPRLGGRMVNTDVPALDTPITGFGRIGFDEDGRVPRPGADAPLGPTCVNGECWRLTRLECDLYGGVWLGENGDCASEPCGSAPRLGGCCVDDGCDPLSAVDCAGAGGFYLGDGVACGTVPCPETAPE